MVNFNDGENVNVSATAVIGVEFQKNQIDGEPRTCHLAAGKVAQALPHRSPVTMRA